MDKALMMEGSDFRCCDCYFFVPCQCKAGVGFCTHHRHAGEVRRKMARPCDDWLRWWVGDREAAKWRWGLHCAHCGEVAIWFVKRPMPDMLLGVDDLVFDDGSHPRWDLPICCQHCGEQLWAANFQTRFLVAHPRTERPEEGTPSG